MAGEQQPIIPNIVSFSTQNPNPLPSHTDASQHPHLQVDESQNRSVIEPAGAAIDSPTVEIAGVTMNETANAVVVENPQPTSILLLFQCEVCNVRCNTKDVLETHKKGKKHLKALKVFSDASANAPNMVPPPIVASETEVGEPENEQNRNESTDGSIIWCDICNVACNSQAVFQAHVASKKHTAKSIIQLASTNGVFEAMLDASGSSQKKPDPLRCELCKISCTSTEHLNIHLGGKKHFKKLKGSGQTSNLSLATVVPNLPLAPVVSQVTPVTEPLPLAPVVSQVTPVTEPLVNLESSKGKTVNLQVDKLVCELCGITCDTDAVMKIHMLGKKHKRNLEKAETFIGPNLAPETEPVAVPVVSGPTQEEGETVYSIGNKRKVQRAAEDVETKKQKALQNGTASDAMKICTVCNVVCTGPKVYLDHVKSRKHVAAMAVKQAETQGVFES